MQALWDINASCDFMLFKFNMNKLIMVLEVVGSKVRRVACRHVYRFQSRNLKSNLETDQKDQTDILYTRRVSFDELDGVEWMGERFLTLTHHHHYPFLQGTVRTCT